MGKTKIWFRYFNCFRERDKALKAALNLQNNYRSELMKGMEWITREGSVPMDYIQYIYSDDKVLKSVMGL